MEKLRALEKKAKEAQERFIYAKQGDNLVQLHKEQEQAYKELREYKQWLYQGSGVLGNTPTL